MHVFVHWNGGNALGAPSGKLVLILHHRLSDRFPATTGLTWEPMVNVVVIVIITMTVGLDAQLGLAFELVALGIVNKIAQSLRALRLDSRLFFDPGSLCNGRQSSFLEPWFDEIRTTLDCDFRVLTQVGVNVVVQHMPSSRYVGHQ